MTALGDHVVIAGGENNTQNPQGSSGHDPFHENNDEVKGGKLHVGFYSCPVEFFPRDVASKLQSGSVAAATAVRGGDAILFTGGLPSSHDVY